MSELFASRPRDDAVMEGTSTNHPIKQVPTANLTTTGAMHIPAQVIHSRPSAAAHNPTLGGGPQTIGSLETHCPLSLIEVASEISTIPFMGPLVQGLTTVFQAVERSRVNNTLDKVQRQAQHYNQMDGIVAFLLCQTMSDEIELLFHALDSCLGLFSYMSSVAHEQWVEEFRAIQGRELEDIQHLRDELEKMSVTLTDQNTEKIADTLRRILVDKSWILQAQATTPTAIFTDAQRIVRIIMSVTKLQLPPMIWTGEQCVLDANVPTKTGITCDLYQASFLGGIKVAKKVFRIGTSDKEYVEIYAKRLLRIMNMYHWFEFRSDYILPWYAIGTEPFDNRDYHFQMYMVLPFVKNFDAMTYLKQRRNNSGIKKSILRIITDAAMGLQYLHNFRPPVVHSGMRGDNILITDSGGAMLGGFGITRVLRSVEDAMSPEPRCGSTNFHRWLAPELFDDQPPLEISSDVWGWAVTTLEVISGSVPYHKHKQSMTVMLRILKGPPRREDYPAFNDYAYRPDGMWALLERCWTVQPSDRPTMEEVVAELHGIAKMTEWDA